MHCTKMPLRFLLLMTAMNFAPQTYARTDDVVSVPHISKQDLVRASQDIYATPPSFALIPQSPQAHSGNIWLRSTDDGLHIWGKVEADEKGFHWPQQKSEMLFSDHIEVWLATSTDVVMPQIGWGNQFGATELNSLKDCTSQVDSHTGDAAAGVKNCERWYNEQVQYRQYLRRLFVRQWLLAGSGGAFSYQPYAFEEFASRAYSGLNENFFPGDLPKVLQPKTDDGVTTEIGYETRSETVENAAGRTYKRYHQTGYHFHIFIPYSAFPPAQQLKLADLYVMVDVFSSAPAGQKVGDYSTTAATRHWGQPDSFNHIRLESPRTFSVTPCDYKLEQQDLYAATYPAWFFPVQSVKADTLRSTFALMNPAGGYMYDPAGVSPEIVQANYFWKQLSNGAFVCGPDLTWRNGTTVAPSKFVVAEEYFEAKTLPDGWSLVRSGPTASTISAFGSGACGACTVMDFDIFAVSPAGKIAPALDIHEEFTGPGQPSAADLTLAPDWKQITLYTEIMDPEQTEDETPWRSTTYCLQGHVYKHCGESKQAQPPDPPHFKEFRDQ